MRQILLTFSFFLATIMGAQNTLTVKDITDGKYNPQQLYGVRPMSSGDCYTVLENNSRIVKYSFKTGEVVETLFDVATAKGKSLKTIDDYILSPDGRRILVKTETEKVYRRTSKANWLIFNISNNSLEALSDNGKQMSPHFSPDGNVVGFVRDNNLFIVKLLYGNAEIQVTKDGEKGKIINGLPDWVYEEEFYVNRSFDFSADSQMLAWVRYDESEVPEYDMAMYSDEGHPSNFSYKYPVAGDPNSKVKVMTYDIKNRVTRTLKVPENEYIPRIQFTSDASKLCVLSLNRHQNRMDVYMANPRSTEVQLVLREENARYLRTETYTDMMFYDGHFSLLSERSGYQHLYWYNLNGQLEQTVTSGNFEVTKFYGYDAETGKFYYQSCQESPLRRAIYVTDKKGNTKKLSQNVGFNTAIFAGNFKAYINTFSSLNQPPVTTLCNNSGKVQKTLIDNAKLKATGEQLFGQRELLEIPTADGVKLNAFMLKPRDFDPSKKYPVVMYQYSGPGSQEVKDSWYNGFYAGASFESLLANEGFITVVADGRGTGFRGAEFEKCVYQRLGQLEAFDQAEVGRWLAKQPYVDASRIAIWGWSYGGFNTLMAMSENNSPFCKGIAIAAPTSWRFYDSVYTERYMRTPNENALGYDTCPLSRARKIQGDLLLIHGTADDNVHYRNCTQMSEALMQADKDFDTQIYTNRNHSIYGGNARQHLFQRIVRFLK